MKKEIKVEKCLSFVKTEDEVVKIIKSCFNFPQMYYIVSETAYDKPVEIDFVEEMQLSKILGIPCEEIQNLFSV